MSSNTKTIRLIVAVLVVIAVVFAVIKLKQPDTNITNKTPVVVDKIPEVKSKDLVVAVGSNITTLDPYDANDSLSPTVAKSFYQGLFGLDKNLKRQKVLATDYKISDDALVYTIDLRHGVKFHDGTDFNAEAVKINFDRAIDPNNALKRSNLFRPIKSIEVVEPYKVKITLKEPFFPFINTLAHPSAVMISPTALAKYGKEIGFHPVGTGPFEFVEWNSTDYVKVKKFAGYWQPGIPKVDSITWRPVVDNNTRAAMLQSGEAHFAYPIPFEQTTVLANSPNLELQTSTSIMQRYLSMNVTQKPFDDIRVRQALNYAIDKDALIKVAFAGSAIPAASPVPPAIAYSKQFKPWPYDVAKAKQLLAEAGYPNGFESTLWASHNHSTAQKVLQFVQQQLAQVGVKVSVLPMDAGQRAAEVEGKGVEEAGVRIFYTGWSASTGEANWALTPLFATSSWPPSIFNTAFYSNKLVDDDLAKALKVTDEGQRQELYDAVQQQIWDDAPWVFLVTEQLVAAQSKKLKNFNLMPSTEFDFYQADLAD